MTAISFAWPVLSGGNFLPGMDADTLARVMQIEWLLMGGGLLYMSPLFIPAESRRGHWIRAAFFVLLSLAFAAGAWDFDGLRGLCAFSLLLYVSFGGSTLVAGTSLRKNAFGMMIAARWIICLPVLFPVLVYFDLGGNVGNWQGKPRVVSFGATFFSILFVLELVAFSRIQQRVTAYVQQRERSSAAGAGETGDLNELGQGRRRFYAAIKRHARDE